MSYIWEGDAPATEQAGDWLAREQICWKGARDPSSQPDVYPGSKEGQEHPEVYPELLSQQIEGSDYPPLLSAC